MYRKPETVHIDRVWDHGPMPTDIELVIGGKYTPIEHLHRGLEQWRTGALQDHALLLREVVRQRPLSRIARQRQPDQFGRPRRGTSEREPRKTEARQRLAPRENLVAGKGDTRVALG